MFKYTITFLKDNGYNNYYQTIVEAEDEQKAFIKARDKAKSEGIKLTNEIWVKTHKHK